MSTSQLDTWTDRDLPFLKKLVQQLDAYPSTWITGRAVAAILSLDDRDALRALADLKRGEYVFPKPGATVRGGDDALDAPLEVTAAALYTVGMWPTPEAALDRIIGALETIAANTDNDDERTKARRFAGWLRSGATTVGLSVASAAISGQLPGAGS